MRDGKYLILCIDDDRDILEQLKVILEAQNYCMAEACSAAEGLEVFQKEKPDLIIVDLMMEEIDAGSKYVKKLETLGNKAPIYLLSSLGEQLLMAQSFSDLGFSGVFQKPIESKALLQALKTELS